MDGFYAFCAWTILTVGAAIFFTDMHTKREIAEQCVDLGTVELREYVVSCDVKFLKSRDKLIPWKEVEK